MEFRKKLEEFLIRATKTNQISWSDQTDKPTAIMGGTVEVVFEAPHFFRVQDRHDKTLCCRIASQKLGLLISARVGRQREGLRKAIETFLDENTPAAIKARKALMKKHIKEARDRHRAALENMKDKQDNKKAPGVPSMPVDQKHKATSMSCTAHPKKAKKR